MPEGFYAMFILYVSVGVLITGGMFVWAVKKGQFKQQRRARYLALDGIEPVPRPVHQQAKWPLGAVVTVVIAFAGLAMMVAFAIWIAVKG